MSACDGRRVAVDAERSRAILRRRGVLGVTLVGLAAIAWSFNGIYSRILSCDIVTQVAGRSLSGGVLLVPAYALLSRGQQRGLRTLVPGSVNQLLIVAGLIVSQSSTVASFSLTSVANVTIIYATAPFVALLIAKWVLGEGLTRHALIACVLSGGGALCVVHGSVGDVTLLGDALAGVMTISFAGVIVISRANPHLQVLPLMVSSTLATGVLFAPFADYSSISARELALLASFGCTSTALAILLFLLGSHYISAGLTAIVASLEFVFAPVWAWVFFGERPSTGFAVGAPLIATAVLYHSCSEMSSRRTRPRPRDPREIETIA
jgi:drug/metabolite transporter (DMT)-like permease